MSREIKFRVWSNELKKYRFLSDVNNNQGLGMGFEVVNGWGGNVTTIYHSIGDVVEQYTGLKDKYGKEIYEGDILKRKDFLFYDGNFIFLPVEYKYAEWELGMRRLNDVYKSCEVVGNIHDNPELSRTMEVSE
ncbi:MAG: YopX family protein [Liquorilactobacillus hordei]|uniref:YopX family protein n=1 Tax=Liquorilactobacillus hordei TaxID=468911 RepID=UPI0039E8AD74